MTFLLPMPTETETIPNPGCWQTSTTLLSLRAHPAPLRHPDGQLPPANAVALHPTSAHGHVLEAPVRWDMALLVVSQPLWKQQPKGWGHMGTQLGSPFARERLSSDLPQEELTKAPMGTVTQWKSSSGPWVMPLSPAPTCSCPQHPAHPSRLRCRSRWSRCRGSPRGLCCPCGSPSSQPWASPPSLLSLRC